MQIAIYIAIIIFTFLVTGSLGKLAMSLFSQGKIKYRTGIVLLVTSSITFYSVVLTFATLAALLINTILGIVVGTVLLVGTIGVGYRTALKDARHSMKIASERRES